MSTVSGRMPVRIALAGIASLLVLSAAVITRSQPSAARPKSTAPADAPASLTARSTPTAGHVMTSAPNTEWTSRVARLSPEVVLAIVLSEIAVLVALMIAALAHVGWLPSAGYVAGTVVPVVAPWAGALGGATFALYGLVFHWAKYRNDLERDTEALRQRRTWNSVYVMSVVLGGVFGTLGALMVVYLTKSISIGDRAVSPTGKIVIAIIAFIVGFHQQYFRTLMKKVAAIVFATPEPPAENTTVDAIHDGKAAPRSPAGKGAERQGPSKPATRARVTRPRTDVSAPSTS